MSTISSPLDPDIYDADPTSWRISSVNFSENKFARLYSKTKVSSPNYFVVGGSEEEINFAESENNRIRYAGDVGFFTLHNVVLRNTGYIFHNNQLLSHPGVMLPYVKGMIDNGQRSDFLDSGPLVSRTIKGPVALITAESPQIYGHWLLDYLPRLWLLKKYQSKFQFRILLPHLVPRWARDFMLDYFDIKLEDFIFFDQGADCLNIEQAIVPTFLHSAHEFHPIMNDFVAYLLERCAGSHDKPNTGERIYISRHLQRHTTQSRRRTMRNEDEIMRIAQDHKFSIICPEQLSWHDQIRVFSSAKIIVGEEGSAMHNSLFAPSKAVIAIVPDGNHVQISLSSLRNHSITSLPAINTQRENGETNYIIDSTRATKMFQKVVERAG